MASLRVVVEALHSPDEARPDVDLAVRSAADVREALRTLADASDVLFGAPTFHFVERSDGTAAILFEPHGGLRAEHVLGGVLDAMRRVSHDPSLQPRRVSLVASAPTERVFGSALEHDACVDRLDFDQDALARPLLEADPRVHWLARRVVALQRRERERTRPSMALRRALAAAVLEGEPTLDTLAARLSVRPRVLRERLATENSSWRVLIDEARRRAAENLLLAGETPTAVQERLGYGDLPSFRRACRRWWGMGPRARRARLRSAEG